MFDFLLSLHVCHLYPPLETTYIMLMKLMSHKVVRACRNAIEFNQLPSLTQLIPGGREMMKLDVLLAIPSQYQNDIDLNIIRQSFPYGQVHFQIQNGGMIASNGKPIKEMGDTNDDMIIVCVAVTVGY